MENKLRHMLRKQYYNYSELVENYLNAFYETRLCIW